MNPTHTILDEIVVDVRRELDDARGRRPVAELERMIVDAPPVRSFANSLRAGFGLIAEIKERSPSQGPMRRENVADAPDAYEKSPLVRCISVLTNSSHFGMNIERLRQIKVSGTKPVLRKDFIFDEYQVLEARAFGADAILLMANLLGAAELDDLFRSARALGLDALFECHNTAQIASVPPGAILYGINSRSFAVTARDYATARERRASGARKDLTTNLDRFSELATALPPGSVRIAESGIYAENAARLRDELGYHAVLVGTSLLMSPDGVEGELARFDAALAGK